MDKREAISAIADYEPDGEPDCVYLPPDVLVEIKAEDAPIDVPFGVGIFSGDYLQIIWDGQLTRKSANRFVAMITHEILPKYWAEAIGSRFWLDLLHRSVQGKLDSVSGLEVVGYDDSDDNVIRFYYSFPVEGDDLKEVYEKAIRIQQELEAPAESVLSDVTTALAASAGKVFRGGYAPTAKLIAAVDNATTSSKKGDSLEDLMSSLFTQVPGFNVREAKVHSETEEMDLVILNGSQDPIFTKDGPIVIVECKNWTAKTGRPEFSILEGKIRNRHGRCTLAFLISWAGFTETTRSEHLRSSREDFVIVCMDGSDIRQAALAGTFPEFVNQATFAALTS